MITYQHPLDPNAPTWWKETFVYQIYPRSFQDSNGDGLGDLNGVTQRLDALQALGVETIWMSPFYASPNDDNGYDISDYTAIHPDFGTMADFDRMLSEMKSRGMRLVIDMVLNHSSDEHPWFQSARQSRDNPFHDFYIWRTGTPDAPPNNWPSIFGGSAWEYNAPTGEWYLHMFTRKQPDLNWANPRVRDAIYDIIRFWLDKGVGGLRFDVLAMFAKNPSYADIDFSKGTAALADIFDAPRLHAYVQEMNREVLSKYDIYTVGEAPVGTVTALDLIAPARGELQTIYHFEHMLLDRGSLQISQATALDRRAFKGVLSKWATELEGRAWNTVYVGNHDQVRPVSRFGDDSAHREASATMLATLLFTHKGIPFFLAGEEIGMTNYPFTSLEQLDDVNARNMARLMIARGASEKEAFETVTPVSRDHGRTPVQWDASPNAGFSSAKRTWLPVNPNYTTINVAADRANPTSIWHYFRQAIALRKGTPALIYGAFEDLDPEHPAVYCYRRDHVTGAYLIVLNMGSDALDYALLDRYPDKRLVLGNLAAAGESPSHMLRPFEARIYAL
jgi:oligo-1,6-glucosidase